MKIILKILLAAFAITFFVFLALYLFGFANLLIFSYNFLTSTD